MTKLMVKNNREKLSRATAEGTEKLKKEKAEKGGGRRIVSISLSSSI